MKKTYTLSLCIGMVLFSILDSNSMLAQCFKRGSFVVSLSEGSNQSVYTTYSTGTSEFRGHRGDETGVRDPIIIEYGISNRWGIGSTWGNDIYNVNPTSFYGFNLSGKNAGVKTSEYTIDGSYHFLVTKKADFALVGSLGTFSIAMNGTNNDYSYRYTSNGNMARLALRTRYYFWRRLGVTSMGSLFAANSSPVGVKDNTVGKSASTSITGSTVEFGLCYRICR